MHEVLFFHIVRLGLVAQEGYMKKQLQLASVIRINKFTSIVFFRPLHWCPESISIMGSSINHAYFLSIIGKWSSRKKHVNHVQCINQFRTGSEAKRFYCMILKDKFYTLPGSNSFDPIIAKLKILPSPTLQFIGVT